MGTSTGQRFSAGPTSAAGTVFKITPGGTLTTLYSFCSQSGCADGIQPEAGLVQGTDGNFYGTTAFGGANAEGTVFKITPGGTLTTLYSFCSQSGCTDGIEPEAGLVQAGGNFYGTTVLWRPQRGAQSLKSLRRPTHHPVQLLLATHCTDGAVEGGLVQGQREFIRDNGLWRHQAGWHHLQPAAVVQQGLTLSCPTFTAQVGVAYNSALTATGGVAPYTFSIPAARCLRA
jgi:uncharacterized repeat protein (TIGR03803 family)